ncbi:MAG: hypothetical protein LBV22_03185 [Mycoplasmataceae bacterium]|nr:hypothetical protein [Mycoplasmataceae bacterium]
MWILHEHNILQETYEKFKDPKYQQIPFRDKFFARINKHSLATEKSRMDDLLSWFMGEHVEAAYAIINFLESREGNSISTFWKLKRITRTEINEYEKLISSGPDVYWALVFARMCCLGFGPISFFIFFSIFLAGNIWINIWFIISVIFEAISVVLCVCFEWLSYSGRRAMKKANKPRLSLLHTRPYLIYDEINKKKTSTIYMDDNNFKCAFFEVLTKEKNELKRILEKYKEKGMAYSDDEGMYLPIEK